MTYLPDRRDAHLRVSVPLPPYWRVPPLATGARNAAGPCRCALCPALVRPGERVADLPRGGAAHVACIARSAP